jgi:hypothetical protein
MNLERSGYYDLQSPHLLSEPFILNDNIIFVFTGNGLDDASTGFWD